MDVRDGDAPGLVAGLGTGPGAGPGASPGVGGGARADGVAGPDDGVGTVPARVARPDFDAFDPEAVEPHLDALLARCREAVDASVEAARRAAGEGRAPTRDEVAGPRAAAHNALNLFWAPVRHLHSVADSEPLRAVYGRCLPKITAYWTELGQNRELYDATRAVAAGPGFRALDVASRREIEDDLLDFELGGVALEGAARARFAEIAERLSALSNAFSEHVLDATRAWSETVHDVAALDGLPAADVAAAAARARATAKANREARGGVTVPDAGGQGGRGDGPEAPGGSGPGWLLNLEYPTYHAVMTFATDRALRERMHLAFVTRASDRGPHAGRFDNGPLIDEILALRAERASLLGYPTHAHLSMARKMAEGPDEVVAFLDGLAGRAVPAARAELETLRAFARERLGIERLEPWDLAFAAERLKRERHAISDEDLAPYFPAPRVIAGLFATLERLFGLRIEPVEDASVWHPDVTVHRVLDRDGALRGEFYLDPFARPDKRGGAWMDVCATRQRVEGGVQAPIAFLTASLTPPVDGAQALLTHAEVTTLFHEFGHGLHHLLTRVDAPGVSGINGVEWDAVELPSQFLENWCWERESLDALAAHHETGEPLPEALLERLVGARRFQAATALVRQLEFALFDMRVHLDSTWDGARGEADTADVQATIEAVRERVAVAPTAPDNRFPAAFSHVFAGGYAAGYFSYKWAEVLSADAFARFESEGLFAREAADDFLHEVLEVGGSRPAMASYVAFRGREPDPSALLVQAGLADPPAPGGTP